MVSRLLCSLILDKKGFMMIIMICIPPKERHSFLDYLNPEEFKFKECRCGYAA